MSVQVPNHFAIRPSGSRSGIGAAQMPAVRPVRLAPEAALHLEHFAASRRELAQRSRCSRRRRRGWTARHASRPRAFGFAQPGVLEPAAIVVVDVAVGTRRPHDLRNRFGQRPVAALAGFRLGARGLLADELRALLFGPLPVGDVLARAVDADHALLLGVPYRARDIAAASGPARPW